MKPRHFLTLMDLEPGELDRLISRAIELKAAHYRGLTHFSLRGRVLAMIFEKSSTRTRVSFEAGMCQLGGSAMFLSPRDTQLGRGEPIEDTARVISRMVDCVMIRCFRHDTVVRFSEHSSVPVINGLSDHGHPCQVLADVQTYMEHRTHIEGRTVAWIGDGNNVCNSWVEAARQFHFQLRIAAPDGYAPDSEALRFAADCVTQVSTPLEAADDADLVVTDVWASMGQEDEQRQRLRDFAGFQVNAAVMARARPDALFMHCLPAHRGEEVSTDVIDGPQSVVWDEAENRLHAQKAVLELLLDRPA
jgi:ornithine carbamoyltransferase